MPSKISCAKDHSTKTIALRDAAIALSEGRPLGVCKKCANELRYTIDHVFPNDPHETPYTFIVTRAVRLETRLADDESYDPFLLVLRETETGKELILPTFWPDGNSNAQRAVRSPPLLTLDEWKALFRQLDPAFDETEQRIRFRAYELYEKRGKRPGHALEDWLQAEAELTKPQLLRPAA